MPQFRYQAESSAGKQTNGELSADSSDQARKLLTARGLTAISVLPAETVSPGRLSTSNAELVLAQIADLSGAGAPLTDGLRAAASESASVKVARALRAIAGQLDRGTKLENILADQGRLLPGHVRGLVAASARTGRLGLALEELVEHHRDARAIWWGVVGSVTYPLIVLGLAIALLAVFSISTVPPFAALFDDFDLELPMATQLLIRTSEALSWIAASGGWFIMVGAALSALILILLATGSGGGAVQRFLATVPFAGALWHWSATAAGTRLLAILLDHGVPLPEALRLSSAGL